MLIDLWTRRVLREAVEEVTNLLQVSDENISLSAIIDESKSLAEGAREVSPAEAPELHAMVEELAERAGAGPILSGREDMYRWAASLPDARAYRPTADERLIREFILQLKRGSVRPPYFTAKYGVKVNIVRAASQIIFQRLSQDLSQKVATADVFSSVDIGNFVALKAKGSLLKYETEADSQLLEPGVTGEWSVRDIIVHDTTWEEEALKYLPIVLSGKRPPRYSVMYGGIKAFNAQQTAARKDLPLTDVRWQMKDVHSRMVELIANVPDDQLTSESRFVRRLRAGVRPRAGAISL